MCWWCITEQKLMTSMNQQYTCKVCNVSLAANSFSRAQINKLEHKKIDAVKCIACTDTIVAATFGTKQDHTEVPKPTVQQPKATKSYDPSMQYIKDPVSAPIVRDAVKFAADHGLPYPVKLGPTRGWRTVVKMAVRGVVKRDSKGKFYIKTTIGLFKPGSHNVAGCLDSPAHHPAINRALAAIDLARQQVGLNGYVEGTGHAAAGDTAESTLAVQHHCYLKYVILALARQSNTVQLSLVWNTEPKDDTDGEKMLNTFYATLLSTTAKDAKSATTTGNNSSHPLFHSIWVNYNPSSRYNNAITGRGENSWRLLHGEQYVQEIVRTDMVHPPTLLFPPFVFRQANICAFTQIIANVRSWIKDMIKSKKHSSVEGSGGSNLQHIQGSGGTGSDKNGSKGHKKRKSAENDSCIDESTVGIRCVELYAGVGTIGLNCLDLLCALNCSDENPHNLACFEAARAAIQSEAVRKRAVYRPQNAATVAVSGGLQGYNLVVVDPPRKGLDDEVVEALLEWRTPSNITAAGAGAEREGKRAKKTYFAADPSANATANDAVDGTDTENDGRYLNNERLIYVSCGFPAFKRDAARLLGLTPSTDKSPRSEAQAARGGGGSKKTVGGPGSGFSSSGGSTRGSAAANVRYWKLMHLEGHILFPGSDHVETLAVFDRVVE